MPVVDAACRADVHSCNDFMTRAAVNISSDAGCKAEMQANQTAVWQTYRGLSSYQALYAATCIQDSTTSSYCFADAVTNTSTPSDAYMYFMPYGMPLPATSTPTCNWCNQQTMGIYHSASSNRNQLVASVYEGAATQINTICGINFVNATLPPASSSAAVATTPSILGVLATAGLVATLWML